MNLPYFRRRALEHNKKLKEIRKKDYLSSDGLSNTRSKWQKVANDTKKGGVGKPRVDYLRFTMKNCTMWDVTALIETLYHQDEYTAKCIENGFPMAGGVGRGDIQLKGLDDIGGGAAIELEDDYIESDSSWATGLELRCWAGNRDIPVKRVMVDLPGAYCERFELDAMCPKIKRILSLGWRPTRIDLCFDDYGKEAPLDWIYHQSLVANRVGFRKFYGAGIDPSEIRDKTFNQLEDFTLYFGSRESDKFTRIYETKKKHGYAGYRVEVECKGDVAVQTCEMLATLDGSDESNQVVYGLVLGHIDFREVSEGNDNHVDRRARVPAWQAYLDYINTDSIKVTACHSEPSTSKRFGWMLRQCSRTLAMLDEISDTAVMRILSYGKQKLSERDEMQIYHDKGLRYSTESF